MYPPMQEQLNAVHAALLAATGAGVDAVAVETAALKVFDEISRCCSEGYEVWAYKGSVRILRMGTVGLFRRTSFSSFLESKRNCARKKHFANVAKC
jgi:hypothetical protein